MPELDRALAGLWVHRAEVLRRRDAGEFGPVAAASLLSGRTTVDADGAVWGVDEAGHWWTRCPGDTETRPADPSTFAADGTTPPPQWARPASAPSWFAWLFLTDDPVRVGAARLAGRRKRRVVLLAAPLLALLVLAAVTVASRGPTDGGGLDEGSPPASVAQLWQDPAQRPVLRRLCESVRTDGSAAHAYWEVAAADGGVGWDEFRSVLSPHCAGR